MAVPGAQGESFESIIAGPGRKVLQVRARHINLLLEILIVILLLAALLCASWVPLRQIRSQGEQSVAANQASSNMSAWPEEKIREETARAEAYNRVVADSGQGSLGEASDPFADSGGASSSDRDLEYQSLLQGPDTIMGTLRVPKISLHLPIYHGTSDQVLKRGVGHLHGTSLPVGGTSANAVLSGHRGLPSALLFTRLDELEIGDICYIDLMGRTMGYRIVQIHVISPDDTHLYKVVPGRDLVTLMTCTPYGVNTQRLVVTAERQPIPYPIPDPSQAPRDGRLLGLTLGLGVLIVGVITTLIAQRLHLPPRHGSAPTSSL